MVRTLHPDDPRLVSAADRLRRIQWAWAALFVGVGVLAVLAAKRELPVPAVPWMAAGLLLVIEVQPAYLALVSVMWGLSQIALVPAANLVFAADPVSLIFDAGPVENLALAIVRVILMAMAWNQFLFYRMLYGTAAMSASDPDLPIIPEVVPNHTDRLAWWSRVLAVTGLLAFLVAFPLARAGTARPALNLALGLAMLSIGIGLGVAFSPTSRRGLALTSVGLGVFVFLVTLAAGRIVLV